jgi:hypothetical protein
MLKSYHVDDALERIKQSEHGAHHLIVYQDLGILRQLYTKYMKYKSHRSAPNHRG